MTGGYNLLLCCQYQWRGLVPYSWLMNERERGICERWCTEEELVKEIDDFILFIIIEKRFPTRGLNYSSTLKYLNFNHFPSIHGRLINYHVILKYFIFVHFSFSPPNQIYKSIILSNYIYSNTTPTKSYIFQVWFSLSYGYFSSICKYILYY